MKLKYYIRGIGIGIIVTALILHFSFAISDNSSKKSNSESVSNDRITLAESVSENKSVQDTKSESDNKVTNLVEDEVKDSEPATIESDATVVLPGDEQQDPEVIDENDKTSDDPDPAEIEPVEIEPDPEDGEHEVPSDAKLVSVSISGGDGSYTVAKKVQQAGLVDSAAKFDEFMCNNGYDKRLTVGVHKIPEGADYKTIADLLVKSDK